MTRLELIERGNELLEEMQKHPYVQPKHLQVVKNMIQKMENTSIQKLSQIEAEFSDLDSNYCMLFNLFD